MGKLSGHKNKTHRSHNRMDPSVGHDGSDVDGSHDSGPVTGHLTHHAVLVDGPQTLHGHISDMAPPKQDLSCSKTRTTIQT